MDEIFSKISAQNYILHLNKQVLLPNYSQVLNFDADIISPDIVKKDEEIEHEKKFERCRPEFLKIKGLK